MQRLLLLGLNHRTAPLELRERLAFAGEARQRLAIDAMRARFGEGEFALISTCNRVEILAAAPADASPDAQGIADFLGDFHHVPRRELESHLYERNDRGAVEHLFSVASSLDSMVVGETQILGQVRKAYERSRDAGSAGAMLNPLFQRAIAAGKDVLRSTSLGRGSASISTLAVRHAQHLFDDFSDKTILCLGAGKMASLAIRGLAAMNPRRLIVCSRSRERTMRVAGEVGAQACAIDRIDDHLAQADLVITCTGATEPVIVREQVQRTLSRRNGRELFIIDIAVPRDVEPAIGDLPGVTLFNLDDLQNSLERDGDRRTLAIADARRIVAAHVEDYFSWQRQRALGPVIDRLYQRLHAVAEAEVARVIEGCPAMPDAQRQEMLELSRRIVNKLLHDPIRALRETDRLPEPPAHYVATIERLFRLNFPIATGPGSEHEDGDDPDQIAG